MNKNRTLTFAALTLVIAALGAILFVVTFRDRMFPVELPYDTGPKVTVAFQEQLENDGEVVYRSFGGKWIGMDGDTDLYFGPENRVVMTEYGAVVSAYEGTFEISRDGEMTTHFPDCPFKWPTMLIGKDEQSFVLVGMSDGNPVMGTRGGMTVMGSHGSYWPFRPAKVEISAFKKRMEERLKWQEEHR